MEKDHKAEILRLHALGFPWTRIGPLMQKDGYFIGRNNAFMTSFIKNVIESTQKKPPCPAEIEENVFRRRK